MFESAVSFNRCRAYFGFAALLLAVVAMPVLADLPQECQNLSTSMGPVPAGLSQICYTNPGDDVPQVAPADAFFGSDQAAAAGPGMIQSQLNAPEILNTVGALPTASFLNGCDFVHPDYTQLFCIDGGVPGNAFWASTADATQTPVGNTGGGLLGADTITGLAWDATTATMYASGTECGVASTLYTVNLGTGVVTAVGPSTVDGTCAIDIIADAAGNLYTHDIVTDAMYTMNKGTGAQVFLGVTGIDANFGQSAGCDPDGSECYAFAFNGTSFQPELHTINLVTGGFTFVGVLGSVVPAALAQVTGGSITAGFQAQTGDCCVDTFSTCCQANTTPGCDDPIVEACVCALDPFCCNSAWDSVCAGEAVDFGCTDCAPTGTGCVVLTAAECTLQGGEFTAGGDCGPDACVVVPPSGECCEGDGTPGTNTCTVTLEVDCAGDWTEGGTCEDGDATCDVLPPTIPTMGEWGLIVMTVLLLTMGAFLFGRRRVFNA